MVPPQNRHTLRSRIRIVALVERAFGTTMGQKLSPPVRWRQWANLMAQNASLGRRYPARISSFRADRHNARAPEDIMKPPRALCAYSRLMRVLFPISVARGVFFRCFAGIGGWLVYKRMQRLWFPIDIVCWQNELFSCSLKKLRLWCETWLNFYVLICSGAIILAFSCITYRIRKCNIEMLYYYYMMLYNSNSTIIPKLKRYLPSGHYREII